MSDLFWLSDRQFSRMRPYFPLSHGVPRSDDLRVISGIIHVIRNGLRWRDAQPSPTSWQTKSGLLLLRPLVGFYSAVDNPLSGQ